MKLRLPRTRRFRVYIYIISTLLVVTAVDLIVIRIGRHISVGYDTTRLTTPLKPDGMPDYALYFSEFHHDGVTRENNAIIPLLEHFRIMAQGVPPEKSRLRNELYESFGILPPTPENAFVPMDVFFPEETWTQERGEEHYFVMTHPWTADAHPVMANWLKANQKALECVPQMAARSRFYAPWGQRMDGSQDAVFSPEISSLQQIVEASQIQIMNLIAEERFVEAHKSILALHHIARLLTDRPTIVEYFVALETDAIAIKADMILANSLKMSGDQLKQFNADVMALAPFPQATSYIDVTRFYFLNNLILAAQQPGYLRKTLEKWTQASGPEWWRPWLEVVGPRVVPPNFNSALRYVNAQFDAFVYASRASTAIAREDLANKVDEGLDINGRRGSEPLSDPAERFVRLDLPYAGWAIARADRHEMQVGLSHVALALAEYKADRGSYPGTLSELAPRYIDAVPIDIFAEKPLHYTRTAEGYLLYSVSLNRKDQGGSGDDIVAKVPQ